MADYVVEIERRLTRLENALLSLCGMMVERHLGLTLKDYEEIRDIIHGIASTPAKSS